jgi:hypothetical protein
LDTNGRTASVVVTLDIERGFHVNANPASFDFLVPTSLDIIGAHALEVRYPKGLPFKSEFAPDTLSVYEGSVRIVARLDAGALDPRQPLRVTVSTQACTQTVCLPPAKIPLTISTRRSP